MPSGGAASGGGSGSGRLTTEPAPRRCDFGRTAPSTSTRPASIRRSAPERDPTSSQPATKRSRRIPLEPGGRIRVDGRLRFAVLDPYQAEREQRDADHDEAVGEVERRPVRDVDEV